MLLLRRLNFFPFYANREEKEEKLFVVEVEILRRIANKVYKT